MSVYVALALAVAIAYLIGGIPWAFILGKAVKGIDLRQVGSGNLGATNVARSLGGRWAVAVFGLDFAKGALAVFMASALAQPASRELFMVLGGGAVILGHVYSPYVKFKGGKGIATTAGVAAMLTPVSLLIGAVTFFAVAVPSRRVSLGSLVIAISYPITAGIFYGGHTPILVFSFAVAATIFWSHRANIGRLIRGEESTVTWGIFKDRSK